MSGVVPPAGPTQPAPSPSTATTVPVEADVETLPPRLSDVPRAVALPGTVVATGPSPDGGAVSRIRTAAGEVVVRTDTPLPPGPVTVQIPPGRPPTQATLQLPAPTLATPAAPSPGAGLSPAIAGATPPPATMVTLATTGTGQPLPPTPLGAAGGLVPPPALATLLPGMSVRAQLLSGLTGTVPGATSVAGSGGLSTGAAGPGLPTLGTPASPGSSVSLPTGGFAVLPLPGTVPTAGLPGIGMPGPGTVATTGPTTIAGSTPTGPSVGTAGLPTLLGAPGASTGSPTPPAVAGAQTPSLPGTAAPGGSGGAATVPWTGSPLSEGPLVGPVGIGTLRVLAIGDGPVRPPIGNGPVAVATVTGTLVGGQPIVATEKGLLVLQAHPGLPAGTRLTLEAVTPPTPSTLPPLAPVDPLGTRDWPALQHALDALGQADPVTARAIGTAIVPQLNARLATNMALFMGIVRGGMDPRAWLGERGAKALEAAGRGELVDRLADDIGRLRDDVEGSSGEWRTYPLPLLVDGAMDRVVVRVRRREDGGEGDADGTGHRGGGGTRFLVDVNLSRLGPLQLDGLVRPKRLDLIIRSREALPHEIRTELRQIFAGAMADLRLAGDLGFQAGRGAPWIPLPVPAAGGRGVVA